jgi:acetyl coenzyme A synthetase (ADP forming)-like protein
VAVVGASRERGKIGSEILHNILSAGFPGRVFAVHPSARAIGSVLAYPRVGLIPGDVDLAIVCVPAAHVASVIDDCITKRVAAVVVITAGFGETGEAGRAQQAAFVAKARAAGIRLVGPNCMGLLNTDPARPLNATFSPVFPPAGRVAMSTQSGALGLAVIDYARELGIGLSSFVSIGNKADVSTNDLIEYWADDPMTDVIVLYVESFGNPVKFSQIARRVGRSKPIIAVKAGRSAAGARAATSHTGALASRDAIADAMFHQCGVFRTTTLEELFDAAKLLASQPLPAGRRVGILTNAGGPAILAADACENLGLELPRLSARVTAELQSFLPAAASVGNPVDMLAAACAADYDRALAVLLSDDAIDAVLVIFIPPLATTNEEVAQAIRRASGANSTKPVLAVLMAAHGPPRELDPIPCYRFPEGAAAALSRATSYAEWRRTPAGRVPDFTDIDTAAVRRVMDAALRHDSGWLPAVETEALLNAVRIPVAHSHVVLNAKDAVTAAAKLGFPVALKAMGENLVHKTDAGGVRLGLRDQEAVGDAWHEMRNRLGSRMTGAVVQKMAGDGVEMLIGAVRDPVFGPVLACGLGGTLTDLLADRQLRLHPLTDADAAAMIEDLRGRPLLRGYRGASPVDEASLRDALLRLSALVGLCPEIQELDVNPLMVGARGVCALDVRVRIADVRIPTASPASATGPATARR